MKCPVRGDLPPLTERIKKLPIDPERGYPVPWFVQWIDGKPEFRLADSYKFLKAIKERLCWVCGERMGKYLAFVIGPMCSINRISSDPPMHLECAEWSVKACPFLLRPNMVRREDEKINAYTRCVAGEMIERNPGVSLIWVTNSYRAIPDSSSGSTRYLIQIGDPEHTTWWKEGRKATVEEIKHSIDTGLPFLKEKCETQEDFDLLDKMLVDALKLVPQ